METPQHGKRLDDNDEVLQSTTFRCDLGYEMKGNATLNCGKDGQWNYIDLPTCTRKLESGKIWELITVFYAIMNMTALML